jgi:N-acylneuraminate cytidylyltransferase
MLAIIPARGGSKGLPGKNIRTLAGLPLIAHSILLSRLCPQITRTIVSTDSQEIAEVAIQFGADVPFMRPHELAQDDTPMWPVLRHALETVECQENRRYTYLLLLDPTSPGRLPEDIAGALSKLEAMSDADGIIGVSTPEFNPIWNCVVEHDGWMESLFPNANSYTRRQDVPQVYRINATLYIWRAEFVRREADKWIDHGRHLIYEVPERRAIHIDDIDEFLRTEALIRQGFICLPWLESKGD